ncbi:MAG: hypothetical protein IPM48_14470 [Saprospiraceae bacterium]|nr:hypothetical protein [Saprospiraceae bacterium]
MKLSENDIKLFKALNKNEYGKLLVDYLERLRIDMFNPEELTKENLEARKDTAEKIKNEIIDRIKLVQKEKKPTPKNQFV